ncbi:biopolymer transporter ExbD [Tautonia marina]|uniref:biopolymer transporter ExbD n=1 Tax=Tautonia marina TaxID=2653855 RepID=UPI001261239A|nr:biopolymer transporter ExbD [Tautonia marina]
MANWDIFHTDRLEAERSLSTEAVRAAVASGAIRADDLVRPAGSSASWARIGDTPELLPSYGAEEPPSPRTESPKTIRPAAPPPPDDREPILDANVVEDNEDDEVIELAEVAEEFEPLPLDADDTDSDFDDSIPAPPLATDAKADTARAEADADADEQERTVELPPRSPKPPRSSRPEPAPAPPPAAVPRPDTLPPASDASIAAETEDEREADSEFDAEPIPAPDLSDRRAAPIVETSSETLTSAELFGLFDPADEDEEAASFTLAAEPRDEPEEIDLTAMVDVAFQLVLFFLVTATTLYFKTLEIPTPDPEDPDAVAQQMRTLDELLDEYILVEIDPQGRISVDREPIDLAELTDRLRQARADTLRSGMLLMADFTTPHRNAVSAIDSANALGLQIAIAKPSPPQ